MSTEGQMHTDRMSLQRDRLLSKEIAAVATAVGALYLSVTPEQRERAQSILEEFMKTGAVDTCCTEILKEFIDQDPSRADGPGSVS